MMAAVGLGIPLVGKRGHSIGLQVEYIRSQACPEVAIPGGSIQLELTNTLLKLSLHMIVSEESLELILIKSALHLDAVKLKAVLCPHLLLQNLVLCF